MPNLIAKAMAASLSLMVVWQNFLNLSSELKNKRYKSCIASLLDELEYPYKIGTKDGFYPEKSEYNFFEKVYRKTKYFISLLNN